MTEIQEQVEQFVKDHWKFDDDYKSTALYSDTHTLLRKVVEECCEVTDRYHADGLTELIQEKFAWLLEDNDG